MSNFREQFAAQKDAEQRACLAQWGLLPAGSASRQLGSPVDEIGWARLLAFITSRADDEALATLSSAPPQSLMRARALDETLEFPLPVHFAKKGCFKTAQWCLEQGFNPRLRDYEGHDIFLGASLAFLPPSAEGSRRDFLSWLGENETRFGFHRQPWNLLDLCSSARDEASFAQATLCVAAQPKMPKAITPQKFTSLGVAMRGQGWGELAERAASRRFDLGPAWLLTANPSQAASKPGALDILLRQARWSPAELRSLLKNTVCHDAGRECQEVVGAMLERRLLELEAPAKPAEPRQKTTRRI